MPNQEIMREWVSRLRSGDYTQGRGKLSLKGWDGVRRHCCLGVLADLAAERGVTPQPIAIPGMVSGVEAGLYNYEGGNTIMPPEPVLEWADIPVGDAVHVIASDELSANALAHLNDGGKTFDQIADLIEEEWIELPEGTEVPDSPADIAEKEVTSVSVL